MATRRSSVSSVSSKVAVADAPDDFYVEAYEPPDSLWQLIKSSANENELDLIKRIIGESLVETSLDLHNEVDTLLEIWRDYRHETMTGISELKDTISKTSTLLPEPPNVRETLKKEITMFVKQMREHFKEEDKFCRQIVANNHNMTVINYALNSSATVQPEADANRKSRADLRPQSKLSSRTGAETPMVSGRRSQSRQKLRYRSGSRSSSRQSVSPPTPSHRFSSMSTSNLNTNATTSRTNQPEKQQQQQQQHVLSEDLELYVDEEKLNSFQIDEIVDHLRDLLQQECDSLFKDIDFLYECIDRESEYRAKTRSSIREPTLNELKEERRKLENDLLSTTGRNQIKINALPANLPPSTNNRSIHSPVMVANRPSPPSSAASNASRTSTISATNILIQTDRIPPLLNDLTLPSKKPAAATKVVETTKRSNSLASAEKQALTRQPGPLSQKGVVVVNSGAIKIMSNPQNTTTTTTNNNNKAAVASKQQQLSRNNSLASIASSIESSASSAATNSSSKLGSAQKFRQMVLDSRDT